MVTTLEKHGDGYALVIDKAMMEMLKIQPDTRLQITPCADSFKVAPVDLSERRVRFEQALEETNRKYGRALKKLAE